MAHQKDFIGKKYGYLTILGLAKYSGPELYVQAKCECGNINKFVLENLERGKVRSCGCLNNCNTTTFKKTVEIKIKNNIEVNGDCWIWKGLHRKTPQQTTYINVCNKQINPVKYLAGDEWLKPNTNILYVRQCETPLCVNPSHHVKCSRNQLRKAERKEMLCEYLQRKRS